MAKVKKVHVGGSGKKGTKKKKQAESNNKPAPPPKRAVGLSADSGYFHKPVVTIDEGSTDKQARSVCLRVVLPADAQEFVGCTQLLIDHPQDCVNLQQLMAKIVTKMCPPPPVESSEQPLTKDQKAMQKIVNALRKSLLKNCVLEIHMPGGGLQEASFVPFLQEVNYEAGCEAKEELLKGGKVRMLEKGIHPVPISKLVKRANQGVDLEMRAVTLAEVEKFHGLFDGKDSKVKQAQLLQKCPQGQSYVEWAVAEFGVQSGPPDIFVSYSWKLNWKVLLAFLKATLGPTARVWIDILACSQHKIVLGEVEEYKKL
jgi:hypothetical protein